MVNKFTNQPTVKEVVTKINDVIDAVNQGGGGGGVSDVKVNNTSVVTSGVANIDLTGYAKTSNLATVATSGSYNDLSNKPTIPDAQVQSNWTETNTSSKAYIKNKPTIPTVNNATLTIQKNGTTVKTFTANASSNVTCNITVPTNTNELTNGAGFVTTDTKNTAGSTDTSSKIFLVGATSQAANPQTYSHDTAFVDTNGRLNSAAPASGANDTTVATTKWVKDQAYKTSITSSDVTTALGYTPYNSTNPSGYQANVIETIKVNGTAQTVTSKTVNITVPDAQIQSDWNQTTTTAKDYIKNKPTIPTVNNATITFTQGGVTKGTITTNQSTNATIALDAGGGGGGASITDVLNVIYPVGSIYVSTNSVNPIASYVGTWELVASNKALWTGDGTNGGTTIAQNLPNITGLYDIKESGGNQYSPFTHASQSGSKALYASVKSSKTKTATMTSAANYTTYNLAFDASKASTVYSDNNSTVQPPAYVVNVWKRTA